MGTYVLSERTFPFKRPANFLAMVTTALALLVAATPGFSAHVDNPWFPLRPGTVYVYRGVKDGERARTS